MRTTSRARLGHDAGAIDPFHSPPNAKDSTAVALIQAAFNQAASTNAMLADVLFPHRLAGASRSGACRFEPRLPKTSLAYPDFRDTQGFARGLGSGRW